MSIRLLMKLNILSTELEAKLSSISFQPKIPTSSNNYFIAKVLNFFAGINQTFNLLINEEVGF